ncbi:MAG: sle2 [Marmoricola sp.]|nr:sle2 [Marmoricola sp.]
MSQRNKRLDAHTGRVLILLRYFGPTADKPLEGLTKLAKLDFLLRYPVFTERVLAARGDSWMLGTQPTEDEEKAVESRMVRYKYGPWDDRYYPILGGLVGMGLVDLTKKGRTLVMCLTTEGASVASALAAEDEWTQEDLRALFLHSQFNVTGSKLKTMIYTELPDVVDRPLRTVI